MFYADRNIRPCTILGYTLTTFPKMLIQTKPTKRTLHRIASHKRRRTLQLSTMQETMTHANIAVDTLVSQVTPLLWITPHESTQLQNTNTQEDVEEILDTRAFQRYVDTPIQTLDGIIVNQPKCFLPLAQEA